MILIMWTTPKHIRYNLSGNNALNTRYAPAQVQTSRNHPNSTKQFLPSKDKYKFRTAPWHSAERYA